METETPPGEDADVTAQDGVRHRQALEQVPDLRIEWKERIFAFQVTAATNFQLFVGNALADVGQQIGLLRGQLFQQPAGGNEIGGNVQIESRRLEVRKPALVEEVQID